MRAFLLALLPVVAIALSQIEYELETRIVGGKSAKLAQFPFQVGILSRKTREGKKYNSWCGGSLISDEWVLTAAHCLQGSLQADIYLGSTHLGIREPGRMMLTVSKELFFIHESYIPQYFKNDIALIKFPQRVLLNRYIQAVNLPKRSQFSETFINQVGWISGWGWTHGIFAATPLQLQYTKRRILPHEYCDKQYNGSYTKDTQICVDGSQKMSPCRGDCGGPLTVEDKQGIRTLVGVTSYVKGICGTGNPSVYTRVTAFLDWIVENTGIPLRK